MPDEKQYVIKLNPNSLYEYTHHEFSVMGLSISTCASLLTQKTLI